MNEEEEEECKAGKSAASLTKVQSMNHSQN